MRDLFSICENLRNLRIINADKLDTLIEQKTLVKWNFVFNELLEIQALEMGSI